MASNEYFRAGVGMMVIDRTGHVLAFERSDVPGSWQLPQGGIASGEEPLDAAGRELVEETGIGWGSVELLGEYPSWLAYELPVSLRSPKTGRGQVHRWFLLRHLGDAADIDLDAGLDSREFGAWRWMHIAELVEVAWEVRRPVYAALQAYWSDHLCQAPG